MKSRAFHPEARAEFAEAALYYASIQSELGQRFHNEMEPLISEVRRMPGTFRFIRKPARRHFSHEFPQGIICVEQPDDIWIVAVMPLRRKPGYWTHRLD